MNPPLHPEHGSWHSFRPRRMSAIGPGLTIPYVWDASASVWRLNPQSIEYYTTDDLLEDYEYAGPASVI